MPSSSKSAFGHFVPSKVQKLADARPGKRKATDDADQLEDELMMMSDDDDDFEDDEEQPKQKMPSKKNATSKGRRKIKIQYIDEKNKRHVSFTKRKAGLMKKAYELSTLTGTECLVICLSETRVFYHFATKGFRPLVDHERGKEVLDAALRGAMDELPSRSGGAGSSSSQSRSKRAKKGQAMSFEDETIGLESDKQEQQQAAYQLPDDTDSFPTDSFIGSIVPHLPRTYSAPSQSMYATSNNGPLAPPVLPHFQSHPAERPYSLPTDSMGITSQTSRSHSGSMYAPSSSQYDNARLQASSQQTPFERAAAEQGPLMSRYVATGSAHPPVLPEQSRVDELSSTSQHVPSSSAQQMSLSAHQHPHQQLSSQQHRPALGESSSSGSSHSHPHPSSQSSQQQQQGTAWGMHSFDPSLRAELSSAWRPPADRHGNGARTGHSIWERDEWQRIENLRREGVGNYAASNNNSIATGTSGGSLSDPSVNSSSVARRAVESDIRDAPTPEEAPRNSPALSSRTSTARNTDAGAAKRSGQEENDDPFDLGPAASESKPNVTTSSSESSGVTTTAS